MNNLLINLNKNKFNINLTYLKDARSSVRNYRPDFNDGGTPSSNSADHNYCRWKSPIRTKRDVRSSITRARHVTHDLIRLHIFTPIHTQ